MSIALRELSTTQYSQYVETLQTSHDVDFRTTIYDQNETPLWTLADDARASGGIAVHDGQVDVDGTEGVPRSLKLTLLDPEERLVFDPATPSSGLYLHRFLGVDYLVRVPDLDPDTEWVRVPVFTGPVSRFSRTGTIVEVEGLGKEVLLQPPNQYPVTQETWTREMLAKTNETVDPVEVITELAASFGETKLRIDVTDNDLTNEQSGGSHQWYWWRWGFFRGGNAWAAIRNFARALNATAYYDAEGYLCVRRKTGADYPSWIFRLDERSTVTSEPAITYEAGDLYNVVRVYVGASLRAEGRLAPEHPLSAESLARNGVQRELVLSEQFDQLDQITAEQIVRDRLSRVTLALVDAQFTTIPIPHLDAGDVLAVDFGNIQTSFELQKFTIPLNPGGTMTIGFTKNVQQNVNPLITSTLAPGAEVRVDPAPAAPSYAFSLPITPGSKPHGVHPPKVGPR